MKKYEYKIIVKGLPTAINTKKLEEMSQSIEDELNTIGNDGWEFIQWKNSMMIFKREKF